MLKLEITIVDEIETEKGTWINHENKILVDGEVVGRAYTITNVEEEETYIEDIMIDEEQRNKGYGTKALYKLAGKYGYLYFAPTDENNQRLYERVAEEIEANAPEVDQGYGVYYLEG